ncbi:WhiB family transcriptional regulator [Rhodococcus sp. 114MFTsu3.1]|uniref:WhiB family transcriptional regulator n=1 Tax=Rhodococcus sp. 114MFTsu3.1 TaxID=1172184 RepID=UPI0003688A76|nr:WhiB family transcriptional regulator [Rhodococcus sp. 114MFTsu3.1]
MTATWAALAAAVNAAPDLHGAACAGQWGLFDPADHDAKETAASTQQRHERAIAICRDCPVLAECVTWASTLRPGEVSGVVAGVVYRPPTRSLPPFQRRETA